MEERNYIQGLFHGIKTLGIGLKTSIKVFFEHHETEQYPENRKTLTFSETNRFCLEMPHNENNEHKCIACGLCQMACPNDSITVTSEMVTTEDGKKKKQLVRYEYNIGQCMFCNLCVTACPQNAIRFNQEFENAVFDKSKLIMQLNRPGSKCVEKPKPAVAPKPAAPAAKSAAQVESENRNAASEVRGAASEIRGAASEKRDAVSETSETKKED